MGPPPLQREGRGEVMRFAVMCNGTIFQQWQADAILELKKHGHQPVLLIIDARTRQKASLISRLVNKKWGTILYTSLENRIFNPSARRPVDLHKDLNGIATLQCIVEKRGYSEYFQPDDLAAIRDYKLDFILRFGFNIIRGGILTAARYGVWSFHHDDEMKYRGGPAGFWEIFRGDPVSGAIMQRLTDKLDGGIILKKGFLKTIMHSYKGNLHQLLTVSSEWPAGYADELIHRAALVENFNASADMPASRTDVPLSRVPGNLKMLKFFFLLLRNRIRFHYKDLLTAEIWNVGLICKPIHEVALSRDNIREADITWIQPVSNSMYLADPAGFWEEGKLHILAEEYSYASQKAGISEIISDLDPVRVTHPGRVPDPDGIIHPDGVTGGALHLSYPFVFLHNQTVYCLPESYQSMKITLFRRENPGGEFVQDRVLLENVRAVDPTLFFYQGIWWLFFTDRRYSNTHLFLYYSAEMTGEYKPHHLNPVKTDIRSARPAGTPFIYEGVLYRPAQDCSITYGGRIAVNRVLRLSPDDFSEETVNFIEPVPGSKYDRGLHTLSAVGNYTLIDGKRYQFNRHFFSHQLRKKINRKDPEDV